MSAASSLTADLDAHWPLDSGTTDATGNGNDGTLEGDASIESESKVGAGALSLDGDGDYMSLPRSEEINLADVTPERTISAWVKVDDVTVNSRRQVIWEEGGVDRGLNIYVFDGRLYVGGWNDDQDQSGWEGDWVSTGSIQSASWHHVVAVLLGREEVEPDTLKGYLDGDEFGSVQGSQLWKHFGNPGVGAVHVDSRFYDIGEVSGSGSHEFAGHIDDVRLYNRPLGVFEIRALRDLAENNLVMWQSMDGNVEDGTPNGNDGTLKNGASIGLEGRIGGHVQLDGTDDRVEIPNSGDLSIRHSDGMVYTFHGFDGVSGPKGRLKSIKDRNDNEMTFQYETLEVDGSGDTKQVLAFVIDTMGREIRYRYFASSDQTVGGRQIGIASNNSGAFGRLAEISDFKGDIFFSDNNASEDFAGQTNNRTFKFDYDSEGHLVRCSEPAITGTPNGNDFPNGKTFRYRYISDANPTDNWSNLTPDEKERLRGSMTHIFYPNEVRDQVDTNPALEEARQIVTYITDPTDPFFGYADSWREGDVNEDGSSNPNGNGVPAGGTYTYTYEDLNPDRDMPGFPHDIFDTETLRTTETDRNGNVTEYTYSGEETLLEKVVKTNRDVRSGEPDYTTTEKYNERDFVRGDRVRTSGTRPAGNSDSNTFNQDSEDRVSAGQPDSLGAHTGHRPCAQRPEQD